MRTACRPGSISWRAGFTLVELLVVIAIIGALVSLLLPAVQAAREASRRTQCLSQMRQLAIAVQNYEDSLKVYPASGIVDTTQSLYESRTGTMFSWIVLILPYYEQKPLHDKFDFNRTVIDQPNDPQANHLKPLLCPSDLAASRYLSDAALTDNRKLAKGNYAAFVGPMHVEYQNIHRGALTSHKPHRDSAFEEGTSNTLLLSEVLTLALDKDQRGAWAIGWTGASQLSFDMHSSVGDGYEPNPASLGATQLPNIQGPATDMLYDCASPAEAQLRQMPCATYGGGAFHYLSAAPRSRHPNGVNVTYVDGHGGFLTNDIDEFLMARLISVEDGEAVSPP